MNQVGLVGNITDDRELRYTQSGVLPHLKLASRQASALAR